MRHTFAAVLLPVSLSLSLLAGDHRAEGARTSFRICSDPNNLPFSNIAHAGFENRIAERLGAELHLPVEYTWFAQRRGFLRNTLNAFTCDAVLGTPSNMERVLTTRPYYRSTYVFVSRHDRGFNFRSFDDSTLRTLKIGVQIIGDDYANAPPAHALAARGLGRNLVGYSVYGDYREANPPARIVDAVLSGAVDVAVVWGPLAGYAARQSATQLDIVPVSPHIDVPYLPFVFDIAVGVRRSDSTFRSQIDSALVRQRPFIDSLLLAYGIPRLDFVTAGVAK